MATGEQADGQTFDQIILPDHDLANFSEELADECAGLLNLLVDRCNTRVHAAGSVARSPAKPQAPAAYSFVIRERCGNVSNAPTGTIFVLEIAVGLGAVWSFEIGKIPFKLAANAI